MNWPYLIIAILFLIALYYLYNKVIIPYVNKSRGNCDTGCGPGCGCGVDLESLERRKKKLD